MQSIPIQPESIAQSEFRYDQYKNQSTSVLQAGGGNSVTIPLGNCLITPDTLLYFPVQNQEQIITQAAVGNVKIIRKFLIGDKRFLSNIKSIFNKITLTSNEINMNSEYSQYVNNLLYYRQNKKDVSNSMFYAADSDTDFAMSNCVFDPLVVHDLQNKHFADLIGTRAADALYTGAAGAALAAIAADGFITYVPIPLKMLLPGLFEFQESFYITNSSLTINFNVNPFIIGYQVAQKQGALAVDVNPLAAIPFNLKFITNEQVIVYQTANNYNIAQYAPSSKYEIKEFSYDLASIQQTITFENVQMFAFMILKTDLAANNAASSLTQDLIYVDNGTVEIQEIKIGGRSIYTSLNPKTLSTFTQQKALESISGFHLPTQILSFCSFDPINSSQSVQISLKTAGTGYRVVFYSISQSGGTQMVLENQV